MPTIAAFSSQVARTDRRTETDALRIGVMGIFGELGSLISEFKKRAREGSSYVSFGKNLTEEAGDLLWYFAALSSTLGTTFDTILGEALGSPLTPDTLFESIDRDLKGKAAAHDRDPWLAAAGAAGRIVETSSNEADKDEIRRALVNALSSVLRAMAAGGVSLAEAVTHNIAKSESRFPTDRVHLPLYDDRLRPNGDRIPVDERLMRKYDVFFEERTIGSKTFVVQKVFSLKIGDPLTDNIGEEDYYRFHDVFHFAYAAVLGWSPVLRALFKLKRKSFPELDENEDGARAVLIEEGISTWIFNTAKPHYFEGATGVDYHTLRTIKEFVQGYEVADQPFWAWEKAILRGYDVFRQLRTHRKGRVYVDLIDRDIRFEL